MLGLTIILFREGETPLQPRGEMRGGAASAPRLRGVPSSTIYRVRYISLVREHFYTSGYYMYMYIHPVRARPQATLRAPRLDIRSVRLFERTTKPTLVETYRSDGRCIILVSYLASIVGLPQVAITTSAIFLPGELSAIKRSIDLLRAARATGYINRSTGSTRLVPVLISNQSIRGN